MQTGVPMIKGEDRVTQTSTRKGAIQGGRQRTWRPPLVSICPCLFGGIKLSYQNPRIGFFDVTWILYTFSVPLLIVSYQLGLSRAGFCPPLFLFLPDVQNNSGDNS